MNWTTYCVVRVFNKPLLRMTSLFTILYSTFCFFCFVFVFCFSFLNIHLVYNTFPYQHAAIRTALLAITYFLNEISMENHLIFNQNNSKWNSGSEKQKKTTNELRVQVWLTKATVFLQQQQQWLVEGNLLKWNENVSAFYYLNSLLILILFCIFFTRIFVWKIYFSFNLIVPPRKSTGCAMAFTYMYTYASISLRDGKCECEFKW